MCFRQPRIGEKTQPMSLAEIMETMQQLFPEMETSTRMRAQIGASMKQLGFEQRRRSDGNCYIAIPRAA